MKMEKRERSFFGYVFKGSEVLAGIAFVLMCGSVTIQIVSRYVFKHSFAWAEEFPIFVFLWASFIAAAAAFRENRHMNVTFFYNLLPPSFQRVARYISLIIILFFFSFLFYYEFQVTKSMGSTFVVLKFSKAFHYVGIPVACILFMVFIVENGIKQIKEDRDQNKEKKEIEM
jgi:TRAP-type C4-dicarboxylate transport system permease small subunit